MQDAFTPSVQDNAASMKSAYRKYLGECGIPSRFLRNDTTLKQYGQTGVFFADLIVDSKARGEYFKDKSALNIYGNWSEEILYGIVRGLLLYQKEGMILSPEDIFDAEKGALAEYLELSVIGVPYFFISDYDKCPFSDHQRYTLERFLRTFMKKSNRILILHSTAPITELTKWYSDSFKNDLMNYGRDVQVDTRN